MKILENHPRAYVTGVILLVLFSHLESFSIDPQKEYVKTPDSVRWDYQELKVTTHDGAELNTWIYAANPETDNDTVVVLAYPDAGNMSYYVIHSYFLAYHGYTVVTFDYRGFGKSSSFNIKRDNLYHTEFSTDLVAVVKMAREAFPDKNVGVWGLSMGTIIATISYEQMADQIDFIIGDAFVTVPAILVERVKEQKDKTIYLPEEENYESQLAGIDVPILIFAGSEDTRTTYQDAVEARERIGENCRVVEFEGDHLRGFAAFGQSFMRGYLENMNAFLEANL